MVEISKHLFEETCSKVGCDVILHPWHPSCFGSLWTTYKRSFIGSSKFYSMIYLAQILVRGKNMLRKEEWAKMGQYYVRSTVFGGLVCANCVVIGCFLSWLQGNKMGYYSYVLIPSAITGAFIYLEPPSRRGLVVNLFSNLVIEYWLKTLERDGCIAVTKTKQTLMFMVGSSLLFYLMRLEGEKKHRTPLFWLFTPEKVRRKSEGHKNVCPHEGSCQKHILKGYTAYFGVGLALTLARVVLPKLSSPLKALSALRGKHLKTALFFGSYIGIYRAVICYLCRRRGFDSALYALPAGYLAGLSLLFNPSLGFAIASLTGAFKLYSTILYEKKILPEQIPLPELLYCFCQGLLFHARFMHAEVCPRYMYKLISSVSDGCFELAHGNMLDVIRLAAV